MQALATPRVAILTESGPIVFSRRAQAEGNSNFVGERSSYEQLAALRPGTVFESGSRWQMVPSKLYRYEDRAQYLAEQHPYLPAARIGVIALPELGAMGLFDRDTRVPDSLYSGNHVAELYTALARELADRREAMALVFFQEGAFWLTLVRNGRVVLFQSFRYREPTDAVFHTAAMIEHYGLEREHCPVVYGGRIAGGSQLEREMKVYFSCTRFADLSDLPINVASVQLILAYERALLTQAQTAAR